MRLIDLRTVSKTPDFVFVDKIIPILEKIERAFEAGCIGIQENIQTREQECQLLNMGFRFEYNSELRVYDIDFDEHAVYTKKLIDSESQTTPSVSINPFELYSKWVMAETSQGLKKVIAICEKDGKYLVSTNLKDSPRYEFVCEWVNHVWDVPTVLNYLKWDVAFAEFNLKLMKEKLEEHENKLEKDKLNLK